MGHEAWLARHDRVATCPGVPAGAAPKIVHGRNRGLGQAQMDRAQILNAGSTSSCMSSSLSSYSNRELLVILPAQGEGGVAPTCSTCSTCLTESSSTDCYVTHRYGSGLGNCA
ncbi:hypothetical protein MN608_05611 [Microdochium nivale]|nr:hypothetical protein MN608_05611 [Microdochium nivale]